jgi:alcohol dehydrogenase (cytochrome c)
MSKSIRLAIFAAIVLVGSLLAACGGQAPSSTPGPTASTPTAPATTAGQLAEAGKTVFADHCAKCHGDQGQGITGPVLIGAANTLDKYGTAQGLLNFIDTAMPLDAPGSLSQQQYLEVVSYFLVQDSFVSSGTALDASNLGSVTLK